MRPIPPGDPDYGPLYGRRADTESINRQLQDHLWDEKAHSVGFKLQWFDTLCFGLGVNSLAVHRYAASNSPPQVAAAAQAAPRV